MKCFFGFKNFVVFHWNVKLIFELKKKITTIWVKWKKECKVRRKMIVLVFLATVLICFSVQFLIKRRKLYKFADDIPSPKCYGLLGHAPYFLGKTDAGEEDRRKSKTPEISLWLEFLSDFRSFGDVAHVVFGI